MDFSIRESNGSIVLEKDNQKLSIYQSVDNDIWFSTPQDELSFKIDLASRNHHEWQTYIVFESLMKAVMGRYVLHGDHNSPLSMLPKDFIDLKDSTITWHCDGGSDNILKFKFNYDNITISMSKQDEEFRRNAVRIRTSGSSYEYYYQEFTDFYRNLSNLEHRLNKPIEEENVEDKSVPKQKLLSIFKKDKNK